MLGLLLAWSAAAQTMPARRSSNYDPTTRDGRFDLRARVDGRVEFEIRGSEIRYITRGGRPPEDAGSEYRKEIPRGEMVNVRLDQRDGRTKIRILEEPSRRNNYALILEIDDRPGGADRYHARITWDDERLDRDTGRSGRRDRGQNRDRADVSLSASGSGDLRYGSTTDRIRRATVELRGDRDAVLLLETDSNRRLRFDADVRDTTNTRIRLRLRNSDLGSVSGEAEVQTRNNQLDSVRIDGRLGRDTLRGDFQR